MSSLVFDEVQTQKGDPNYISAHPVQDTTAPDIEMEPLQPKVSDIETTTNKKDNSAVWRGFEKIVDSKGKVVKAKCKYCKRVYKAGSKNGTSTLWKHFYACIKNPERGKNKKQKCLTFQKEDANNASVISVEFNQELLKIELCKMIVVDELPFMFVEREGFRRFIQLYEPRFKIPSRHTVARGSMQLYLNERKKLASILQKNTQRICFTTDIWTSLQNISYMCLTVHFIDDGWKLHKRILNFCPISSHKGDDIGREIEKCLNSWKINQIYTITMDNASANEVAANHLKRKLRSRDGNVLSCDFMHVRCVAHILNLIVNDGLKELDVSIQRIRDAVRYVRSSPQRLKRFDECVEEEKIQSKSRLCLDVVTRWNSTYLMLESAIKFKKAFYNLEEVDYKFKEDLVEKKGLPNEEDWQKAEILVKFLKAFYDVTLRISGSLYVTSNNAFLEISSILCLINQWAASNNVLLRSMAIKMKEKFDKYWGSTEKMNMLLFVAMVLDPRYKLKYLKAIFHQVYDRNEANRLGEKVMITLEQLFEFYGSISSTHEGVTPNQNTDVMELDEQGSSHLFLLKSILSDKLEAEEFSDKKSELEKYLDEQREKDAEKFDILNWWKVNATKFPVLSCIAKDVLAIPVSTVASESAFSVGGRILDSFRSSLTPKVVEALICGQDWIRASPLPSVEESSEDVDKLEEDFNNLVLGQGGTLTETFHSP